MLSSWVVLIDDHTKTIIVRDQSGNAVENQIRLGFVSRHQMGVPNFNKKKFKTIRNFSTEMFYLW